MALTERSRSVIYHSFTSLIDDEQAVEEMLSYFPARDLDEPVTKEFVRAEIADVRTDIADVRIEIGGVRAEIAGLRAETHERMREMQTHLITMMLTIAGLNVAITAALFTLLN